jgi:hypothetical protein
LVASSWDPVGGEGAFLVSPVVLAVLFLHESQSEVDDGGARGWMPWRAPAGGDRFSDNEWVPDEVWSDPARGSRKTKWDSKQQKKRQADEIRKSLFNF